MNDNRQELDAKKKQAYILMIIGGILFALAIIVPTEQGSKQQMVKIGVGLIGLVLFFLGSYRRPQAKQPVKE